MSNLSNPHKTLLTREETRHIACRFIFQPLFGGIIAEGVLVVSSAVMIFVIDMLLFLVPNLSALGSYILGCILGGIVALIVGYIFAGKIATRQAMTLQAHNWLKNSGKYSKKQSNQYNIFTYMAAQGKPICPSKDLPRFVPYFLIPLFFGVVLICIAGFLYPMIEQLIIQGQKEVDGGMGLSLLLLGGSVLGACLGGSGVGWIIYAIMLTVCILIVKNNLGCKECKYLSNEIILKIFNEKTTDSTSTSVRTGTYNEKVGEVYVNGHYAGDVNQEKSYTRTVSTTRTYKVHDEERQCSCCGYKYVKKIAELINISRG